jgi:hypothetical protein
MLHGLMICKDTEHQNDTQGILGAIINNLVAMATWNLEAKPNIFERTEIQYLSTLQLTA